MHSSSVVRLRAIGSAAALLSVLLASAVVAAPASAEGTTGSLSGHVTRGGSGNASYAWVVITSVGGERTYNVFADDYGNWIAPAVEEGDYIVQVPASMYTGGFDPEYYDDAQIKEDATVVPIAAGASVVLNDIVLDRQGTVAGQIKAADRILSPVNISLHLATPPYSLVATSQSNFYGDYSLSARPGQYKLKFSPADDHDEQWLGGYLTPGPSETITIKAAAYTDAGTTIVGENFSAIGAVAVSGTPAVGKVLTASTAGWVPTPSLVTFQWFRNGSPITLPTYSGARKVSINDAGQQLTVVATSTLAGYLSATSSSAPVTVELALTSTPTPTISGTSLVGKRLTATAGTWSPAPVTLSYRWTRDGKAISGATSRYYTLTRYDRGHDVRVVVTGSKSGYSTVVKTSARRTIR